MDRHIDWLSQDQFEPRMVSYFYSTNLFFNSIDEEYLVYFDLKEPEAQIPRPACGRDISAVLIWLNSQGHISGKGIEFIVEGEEIYRHFELPAGVQEESDFKDHVGISPSIRSELLRTIQSAMETDESLTLEALNLYRLTIHLDLKDQRQISNPMLCIAQFWVEGSVEVRRRGALIEKSFESINVVFMPLIEPFELHVTRRVTTVGRLLAEGEEINGSGASH